MYPLGNGSLGFGSEGFQVTLDGNGGITVRAPSDLNPTNNQKYFPDAHNRTWDDWVSNG